MGPSDAQPATTSKRVVIASCQQAHMNHHQRVELMHIETICMVKTDSVAQQTRMCETAKTANSQTTWDATCRQDHKAHVQRCGLREPDRLMPANGHKNGAIYT